MSEEKSKKISGCLIVIIILIVVLILVLIIIGIQGAFELKESIQYSTSTLSEGYRITRETGFYESYLSEEYSETIKADAKVKPANNALTLDCRTASFEGIDITSCWVEIIASGKQGWVLKNAISK